MKRRNFIINSAASGTLALISGILYAGKQVKGKDSTISAGDFDLSEVTIHQLQDGMKTGKYTSVALVELYLKRIKELDKEGPSVNSVIQLNPDVLEQAAKLDQERKSGNNRGAMHGIPVLLKDNIATADKMVTSAGSLALANSIAPKDAFIVSRLRDSGAVILGKTNLSEWANFRSNRSSSGWSGRGGQTHNPYVLDRSPCGSSSGSAVAVSANFCTVAVGTETDGSIVCPSSTNGIVGIKPTLGLVSRSGIIPISHSQDTAGPMARTVTDAAILLGVLAGIDPTDSITAENKSRLNIDYTRFLDVNGLKGARIGVARNFFGFHEKVDLLMEMALEEMKKHGVILVDPANIDYTKECGLAEDDVLHYEFKAGLNNYLSSLPNGFPIRSLEQIIDFNKQHADTELRFFGQEVMIDSEKKGPLSDQAYVDALANLRKYSRDLGIDATMKKYNLDAVVAPTGGPAWTIDMINGDRYLGGSSTSAACAGYPSITVPCGFIEGLPVGISFFGKAWSEPQLISYAYAYEQITKHRKVPEFISSLKDFHV